MVQERLFLQKNFCTNCIRFNVQVGLEVEKFKFKKKFFIFLLTSFTTVFSYQILANTALPHGVPETTSRKNDCFLAGEIQNWNRNRQRLTVDGCQRPIIAPTVELNLNISRRPGSGPLVYDCQKLRSYTYNVDGIRTALNELVQIANTASSTNANDTKNICIANTLYTWAQRNGLGGTNPQASESDLRSIRAVRSWNMGAFASIYIKLPSVKAAAIRMNKDTTIQSWFTNVGNLILEDVRAPYATNRNRHKKNIYIWKGYSLLALALATQNAEYTTESRRIFDIAIGQIQAGNQSAHNKGFMHHELLKRDKAHTYHIFTLKPILGMVRLSKAMNCNFARTTKETTRLAFLIRKIAEGNKNPMVFRNKTGYSQLSTNPVEGQLKILQSDIQKTTILELAQNYLTKKNMTLNLNLSSPSENYLGGNVQNLPTRGSLASVIQSNGFSQLCGN